MRSRRSLEASAQMDNEMLTMAIGLVWGHLNAHQAEQAYALARGCLQLWPQEPSLSLMAALAAAEMLEPVELAPVRRQLDGAEPGRAALLRDWIALVERRCLDAGREAP